MPPNCRPHIQQANENEITWKLHSNYWLSELKFIFTWLNILLSILLKITLSMIFRAAATGLTQFIIQMGGIHCSMWDCVQNWSNREKDYCVLFYMARENGRKFEVVKRNKQSGASQKWRLLISFFSSIYRIVCSPLQNHRIFRGINYTLHVTLNTLPVGRTPKPYNNYTRIEIIGNKTAKISYCKYF